MSLFSPTPDIKKDIRHIPLSYNHENSEVSALRLLLALFPQWEHQQGSIEFIPFKEGITNTLLKAEKRRPGSTQEQIDHEAVLLRAYGQGTEILIDRQRETTSHSLLAQHKLASPLLAQFENGLIYEYIQGKVCSPPDLTREPVWRGVARRIAQWHALLPVIAAGKTAIIQDGLNVPLAKCLPKPTLPPDAIEAISSGKPVPNIWTVMQNWIFALPKTNMHEMKRRTLLQQELDRSVADLASLPGLGDEGLVFGHCDLLSGNVIVQPRPCGIHETVVEDVIFIDYEYATPSPVAFDLANHFAEWGGFECDYNALPTRAVRQAFVEEYMASYSKHAKLTSWDKHVSRICEEVDMFRGIPGLYWGIWALIQATISQIDFDYATYAETRLAEYWAWRAEQDGSRIKDGREMPLRERRWAE